MKKLAVLVSAMMVAALAAPALAADFQLSGSMESEVTWRQHQWLNDDGTLDQPAGVSAATSLKLNAALGTPDSGLRAVVKLSPMSVQSGGSLGPLSVDRAFLEASGQLWQGGSVTRARLGSLDVSYSPYVATFGWEGFSIDGVGYGPVGMAAFAGRSGEQTVLGAQIKAALAGVAGALTAVNAGGRYDWEMAAAAIPMQGIALSGVYAASGTSAASGETPTLARLDAQAQILPNVTVTAGYRKVYNTFEPAYVARQADGTMYPWIADNRGEHGVNVGVQTVQQGVNLAAGVDVYQRWVDESGNPTAEPTPHRDASLAASTTLDGFQLAASSSFDLLNRARTESRFSVAYPVTVPGLSVTPAYEATIDQAGGVAHKLTATATLDAVPNLPGIGLEGRVARAADGSVSYGADLRYTAPNGLAVGVHHDSVRGAWVDAGLKAEF
ncbi:MAG: hypothetical protein AB1609_13805 [Bacillota bacterium]